MTTDTLDLPPIADPVLAAAPALPATTDHTKVDLQAVALAHFGDWRADVAAAKQNLSTLALDLSIPARITDAKGLRQRLINGPIADVRATSKGLKSKLAAVSKAVGAEEELAVAAYTEAGQLITPKIEAAEQAIETARKQREEEAAKRIADLKVAVDAKLTPWLDRCNAEGMTAERVAAGAAALGELTMPPEFADVAAYWAERLSATTRAMESRRLALAAAELEAAQAKIRAEAQRVAGIQQRIAEIQAAATGHEHASAADLAEALAIVRALRIDADTYAEFLVLAQAARDATVLALDGLRAAAAAREHEEAAERARLAAAAALPPAPPPQCETNPGVTARDAQEGGAENPLQLEPAADLPVGDLAADGAGDGSQSAATPPTPAAGRVIVIAPDSNAIWGAALRGDGAEVLQAGATLIRGEVGAIDDGIRIVGNPPFAGSTTSDGYYTKNDDGPLETSEAEARPWAPSPFYDTPAPATDPHDDFVALVMTAFDCKFPSHPKPSQEWWARVRAAGLELQQ